MVFIKYKKYVRTWCNKKVLDFICVYIVCIFSHGKYFYVIYLFMYYEHGFYIYGEPILVCSMKPLLGRGTRLLLVEVCETYGHVQHVL